MRLEIEWSEDQITKSSELVDNITHELLEFLPNLRIFKGPLIKVLEKYQSLSKGSPLEHRSQILGERLSEWRSIRTMDLLLAPTLSITVTNSIYWVELPHLESLRVVACPGDDQYCNWMARYIANHWKVPSLRSLAFHNFDLYDQDWSTFFENWGRNLQMLKIHCYHGIAFKHRLSMPNLSVLYIHKDHWVHQNNGFNWLDAPNIRCLGIFDLHTHAFQTPDVHELHAFPNVREVHLHFEEDARLTPRCLTTV